MNESVPDKDVRVAGDDSGVASSEHVASDVGAHHGLSRVVGARHIADVVQRADVHVGVANDFGLVAAAEDVSYGAHRSGLVQRYLHLHAVDGQRGACVLEICQDCMKCELESMK